MTDEGGYTNCKLCTLVKVVEILVILALNISSILLKVKKEI
jgi:hypothetical protein